MVEKDLLLFASKLKDIRRVGITNSYRDYTDEVIFQFNDGTVFAIYGWYGGNCLQESYVSYRWLDEDEIEEALLDALWAA